MSDDKRSVHTDALATLGTIITENEKRDAIHLAVIPMMAEEYLCPGEHLNKNGSARLFSSHECVGIVDPFLTERVKPGEWFWLVIYPRTIKSLRHVWEHPAFPDEPVKEERQFSKAFMESANMVSISIGRPIPFPQIMTEDELGKHHMEWMEKYGDEDELSDEEAKKEESKKWIEDYAKTIRRTWEDVEYGENPYDEAITYEQLMEGAKNYIESDECLGLGDNMNQGFNQDFKDEFWDHYEVVMGIKVPDDKKIGFFKCAC